jgi:hypothetical protein
MQTNDQQLTIQPRDGESAVPMLAGKENPTNEEGGKAIGNADTQRMRITLRLYCDGDSSHSSSRQEVLTPLLYSFAIRPKAIVV